MDWKKIYEERKMTAAEAATHIQSGDRIVVAHGPAAPVPVLEAIAANKDAYKAGYYQQMMNGLMTQLVRIEPGKDIEEAHMRDRQLIARWVYDHAAQKEVEIIERDGKHYLQVNDYEGLRRLFGELLREIQRITSEGDYAAAKDLVETYAVKVEPTLHQEILARYEKLHLAPYKGFVNPVYTLVTDHRLLGRLCRSTPSLLTRLLLPAGCELMCTVFHCPYPRV